MNYWLMKTEPETFGIDDLAAAPDGTEHWDGIRNYQARNMMRDEMRVGDRVFIYHSNCKVPGIVGLARVASEAYPDHTAWNPESHYYDPKSDPDKPRWMMVDIRYDRHLARNIALAELKDNPELEEMLILRKGNRLSITPVTEAQWKAILAMEKA